MNGFANLKLRSPMAQNKNDSFYFNARNILRILNITTIDFSWMLISKKKLL